MEIKKLNENVKGNYLKDLINLSVKGFNTESLKFVYSPKKIQ